MSRAPFPFLALLPLLAGEVAAQGDDARELFLTHCASCHGERGDGRGTTPLPRPARSFLDGGFSYGNTPEAIGRTIAHGIPGTPMPGFSAALTEEERGALVAYVVELGPEREEVERADTVMAVGDRPRVARGFLREVAEGAPAHGRGLLVGMPTGTTFQYGISETARDLRLLAVRQGEFVERRDWNGRGGQPLEPLGTVAFLCAGGAPGATFRVEDGAELVLDLASTRVLGDAVWIDGRLRDAEGRVLATVSESPRARWTSVGAGFTRRFELSASPDGRGRLRAAVLFAEGQPLLPTGGALRAWRRSDGTVHVAHVVGGGEVTFAGDELDLDLAAGTRVAFEVTLLAAATWDTGTARAVTAELGR